MQSRYEHCRLLEEIVQNTEPKSSTQIVVIDNSTKLKTTFNPQSNLTKTESMKWLWSILRPTDHSRTSVKAIMFFGIHLVS